MRVLGLLLACAAPGDDATTPARWDVGAAATCDVPRGHATWREATTDWAYAWDITPPPNPSHVNPGAVALVGGPSAWGLAWVEPNALGLYDSRTGAVERAPRTETPASLAREDLDGDGRDDLLVAGHAVTVLWSASSADHPERSWSDISVPRPRLANVTDMATGDLDEDGDPDVVAVYSSPDTANHEAMRASVLRNDGGRVFTEFLVPGDANAWGPAFDVSIHDVNGDGHLDALVCNDLGATVAPNRVYLGDGLGGLALHDGDGLDVRMNCMGLSWGDVDADGVLELFVGASRAYEVFDHEEGAPWVATAVAHGLHDTFGTADMVWGSALEDFDNNGKMELFAANGDFWTDHAMPQRSWWYEFETDRTVRDLLDTRGFPDAHARGVIARDLNADGLPDLVVSDARRTPHVLLSEGCTADAWLEFEAPAGTRLVVEADDVRRAVSVEHENGWGATADARAHVGLGAALSVDRVRAIFPGGATDVLEGPLAPRRRITVRP